MKFRQDVLIVAILTVSLQNVTKMEQIKRFHSGLIITQKSLEVWL